MQLVHSHELERHDLSYPNLNVILSGVRHHSLHAARSGDHHRDVREAARYAEISLL